ncbi:MAG TPA: hypothetical protein VMV20_04100, partial [Chitinophagaceae bacterium]|nr:hypothetical protein [Chitinophagaceae bacterium]
GYNTRQSILSGCLGGAVAETEGLIGKYRSRYEGLKVLLTGGDSPFFNRLLETETSLVPDLLLRGLLAILEFNPSSPPT